VKEKMVNARDKILNFPDRHRVQEEASYWLVKLDSDDLYSEESNTLLEWMNHNPENKRTLVELAVLWNKMDVLSELSDLFPLIRKDEGHFFCTQAGIRRSAWQAAVAVCICITVSMAIYLASGPGNPGVTDQKLVDTVYRTAVGEQKHVELPDGSVTTLNTDSVLEVLYNNDQRNIRLVKGEAHFNVAHDKSWPFIVYAGTGIIRAVGTAFSVHLKGEDVEVVVDQGSVKIASASHIPSDSDLIPIKIEPAKFLTTINAGQSVEYEKENIHPVQQIEPKLMSQKLAWQHGMLVFDGDPLEKVVNEISRYTDTRIVISDPAIRSIRVGGYFRTGETEALLTVLQDNFSIQVDHSEENIIYLSAPKIQQATRDVQQLIETER